MCSQQKWWIDVQIQKGFTEDLKSWNLIPKTSLAQLTGNSIIIDQKNKCWIIEKQWKVTAEDGKILDKQHRCVVPKKEILQYWQIAIQQ